MNRRDLFQRILGLAALPFLPKAAKAAQAAVPQSDSVFWPCSGGASIVRQSATGEWIAKPVATAGVWNAPLSPDDIRRLYAGEDVRNIKPEHLVRYW